MTPHPRDDATTRSRTLPLIATGLLALALAACAPGATSSRATPDGTPRNATGAAALSPLERTAWEAWHLMQIGFLRNGVYSTNVLVDLPLPQGVRWTVVSFEEDGYALSVTADDEAGGYLVDPDGVRPLG